MSYTVRQGGTLEEFKNLGIDFVSFQENIDTSSPLGGAIFTIISAVAQLEMDIISERVRAGLRRARENGKRLGRPRAVVDLSRETGELYFVNRATKTHVKEREGGQVDSTEKALHRGHDTLHHA